jgi:hypothetical protein
MAHFRPVQSFAEAYAGSAFAHPGWIGFKGWSIAIEGQIP